MGELIIKSDWVFQVWRYTVSHRQLLLRSNRDSFATRTRLEVLFKDVAFMAVPPMMNGITIVECALGNLPVWIKELGISGPWYSIETDGPTGYVAAGAVAIKEDELEYYDPSSLLEDSAL